MYDVVVIGAGPAGLTAAIYCCRQNLNTMVLEHLVSGGQMSLTLDVLNYPGFTQVAGFELSAKFEEQAKKLGAIFMSKDVTGLDLEGPVKRIFCGGEVIEAKALIYAAGGTHRHLDCDGEDRLTGRGVSYCATCDGGLYKGKTVAVAGGGNTALNDALYLAGLCEKVYLIHRRDQFRGEKKLQEKIFETENIHLLFSHQVAAIHGDRAVEGITVIDNKTGEGKYLDVSGIFVAVGISPETGLLEGKVELDDFGYVKAAEDCVTSVPGIFAAGDVRRKPLRQIITAAADGAVAASAAGQYLEGVL